MNPIYLSQTSDSSYHITGARALILKHRHEQENGRTSAVTVEIMGYKVCVENGKRSYRKSISFVAAALCGLSKIMILFSCVSYGC